MQHALRERRGDAGDRGVRQDAHHVLLGATMPAVLVEVGFLDHPIEGKQLADPAVQDRARRRDRRSDHRPARGLNDPALPGSGGAAQACGG